MARSAKQKAATKRLVAFNKARRRGKIIKVKKISATRSVITREKKRKGSNKSKSSKKTVVNRSRGFKGIFKGTVGKVAMGIGAGTITATAVSLVAPQFAPIARPIGAFLAGGPIGLVADLFLSGGLGPLTSMFGFGGGGNGGDSGAV